jgi:hypothetical protein
LEKFFPDRAEILAIERRLHLVDEGMLLGIKIEPSVNHP